MPTKTQLTSVISRLDRPEKIQNFLNKLRFNFEKRGETVRSPGRVLEVGEAHCLEGALLAAAALRYHGQTPLLLDLRSHKKDFDHVVALFKSRGRWGAISKTNHAVLRYREPVYKNVRELALSYFHEYFLPNGQKTLLSFSKPFNLNKFGRRWLTSKEDLFEIATALDKSPHEKIVPKGLKLRKADPIEIKAGELVEWRAR